MTKNRLARLALKGTQYEGLDQSFPGPAAIATSDDPVATVKAAVNSPRKMRSLVLSLVPLKARCFRWTNLSDLLNYRPLMSFVPDCWFVKNASHEPGWYFACIWVSCARHWARGQQT